MNTDKQQILIEMLLGSHDTYATCANIIKPGYFSPEWRQSMSFIHDYYDKYHNLPSCDLINAECSTKLMPRTITKDQTEYCGDQIENFCKEQALSQAVIESAKKIHNGESGGIQKIINEALMVSRQKYLGLEYFTDPTDRMINTYKTSPAMSTGWKDLDLKLGGGTNRGQLVLVSANSGGGKSIVMANYGLNRIEMGQKVLYVTLELDEPLVAARYDSMITKMQSVEIQHDLEKAIKLVQQKVVDTNLRIVQKPAGSSTNDIRAYMNELQLTEGWIPDLLIVDYLDLMSPNDSSSRIDAFQRDKEISEELRNLLVEYDIFGMTASQQNRAGVDQVDPNHSHIAGGISKINTCDVMISIIMTQSMREQGEMIFALLKTRSSDGVGSKVLVRWNPWLRITNHDGLAFNPKSSTPAVPSFDDFTNSNRQSNIPSSLQQFIDYDE